jgi:hypothetical protein
MERTLVNSSNVTSIGYDPASATLEIEFTNGSIYQYFDVPESVHVELMGSASIGRTVNMLVKQNHRFSKQ